MIIVNSLSPFCVLICLILTTLGHEYYYFHYLDVTDEKTKAQIVVVTYVQGNSVHMWLRDLNPGRLTFSQAEGWV